MSLAELTIERLALGGSGVGRINGKVCFVPFTAPGDRLKVRVVREQRAYSVGMLVEVCEPSSQRVKPRCPVFGQCGGCDWQHINYADQCKAKQEILTETLQRVARLATPAVRETVESDLQYGYRTRAQFKLFSSPSSLVVGFYRRGSRHVIDLPQGCPIVADSINSAMACIRQVLNELQCLHLIPQISLEEGLNGVVAIVQYAGTDQKQLIRFFMQHQSELGLAGLFLQTGRKDSLLPVFGSGHLTYSVPVCGVENGSITLGYEIGGFSQVNRNQNCSMINLICSYARAAKSRHLLDLYCGNGNLSLPLSFQVQKLQGIEGFAPSIASAVDNARQLRVNNSTFKCRDAALELRQLIHQKISFDLVLLDPPRAGAAEVAGVLGDLGPEHIIYVSCDPATLSRDLALLINSAGYQLIEAIPLDMFPQTGHLETVALLSRT